MVAFPADPVWTDGEQPTAARMNTFRDALLNQKEGDGSPAVTARAVPIVAPELESLEAAPQFLIPYSSGNGSSFRIVAESTTDALADGDIVRLDMIVGERDGGTERTVGYYECRRLEEGEGELILNTMKRGLTPGLQTHNDPPALRIGADGKVYLGTVTDNALVNVGGDVQASAYFQNGSPIGAWTLVDRTMWYDGDAEVDGQLIAGAENDEGLDVGTNETLVANLNVPKMRGYGWSNDETMQAVASVGVPLPAGFGGIEYVDVLVFPPAPRPGWWDIVAEITVPTTSEGHLDGGAFFLRVPGGYDDTLPDPFFGSGAAIHHTHQVKGAGCVQVQAGEIIRVQAANATSAPGVCLGSAVATWCAPNIGVFSEPFELVWTYGEDSVGVSLEAPTGLAYTPGHEEVFLTWDALAGADTYSVYRAPTSGGTFVLLDDTLTDPEYNDTGLTNGEDYFYVVSGTNEAGEGPTSGELEAIPGIPIGVNLILNPSNEMAPVSGELPHWLHVNGGPGPWKQYDGSLAGDVAPPDGTYAFAMRTAGEGGSHTTLYQFIDLTEFATQIDAGTCEFEFDGKYSGRTALVRHRFGLVSMDGASLGASVIADDSSGTLYSFGSYTNFNTVFTAPVGTRAIWLYLLGGNGDAPETTSVEQRYDELSLVCNHD